MASTAPSGSTRREGWSGRSPSGSISTAGSPNTWRAAGLDAGDAAGPLFRAAQHKGHGGKRGLTTRPLAAYAIRGLVKRRLKDVGLPTILSPHSFRVLVVTDLLEQGVPLEDVQYLAGHARPTTTQIYDWRRGREVSRNLVERISV